MNDLQSEAPGGFSEDVMDFQWRIGIDISLHAVVKRRGS